MHDAGPRALTEPVDNLHFATRMPKYEVLAAIVRAGLADMSAIEAELKAQRAAGE